MLSALIGVSPSARVAEVPAAVAGGLSEARATLVPARVHAMRPRQARPALAAVLAIGFLVLLFVPAVVPAWASRRRQ